MLQTILSRCDERYRNHQDHCSECSYGEFCPHDCERCLDFIHNPGHAPSGAPDRKYDCTNMADMYTCTFEINQLLSESSGKDLFHVYMNIKMK